MRAKLALSAMSGMSTILAVSAMSGMSAMLAGSAWVCPIGYTLFVQIIVTFFWVPPSKKNVNFKKRHHNCCFTIFKNFIETSS